MLLIKDKRPSLNTQTDSIHVLIALLFIRYFFFFFFFFVFSFYSTGTGAYDCQWYLELKADHDKYLFNFFSLRFFWLRLCHPLDEIILFLKNLMYFHVIPDNSHDIFRS